MEKWDNLELQQIELSKAKKRVKQNWLFWKPIIYGILSYDEASKCDMDTLFEASFAVDIKLGIAQNKE